MTDQTIEFHVRASRVRRVIHVRLHGSRGKLSGIVVDLSRTGALLTVRGKQWEVGTEETNFSDVSLRVASHFGDGMHVEFLEAGRTVQADAVRFTEANVDGKPMICLGCRFETPLTSEAVGSIVHDALAGGTDGRRQPPAGEPVRKVIVRGPAAAPAAADDVEAEAVPTGVPVRPDGFANSMHDFLRIMVARDASDLHMRGGSLVRLRVRGELRPLSRRILTPDEATAFIREILTEEEYERFTHDWDFDFGYSAEGIGRFRINVLTARGEIGVAIRRIPDVVPTIEGLGLEPELRRIAELHHGLVLITGPTGSGKSTTLAAMVRHINETRACHIVTMEDPIEYVHNEELAQITQREVGRDVHGFTDALRRAMRQDPDVMMVGEMRDLETIALAVTAAETGHLVFGTLHTTSASSTIERIIDVFPAGQQPQIRLQLASSLAAVCAQVMVPHKNGKRLVVAQEILTASHGVRALIREGKASQLTNAMQTGSQKGMQTLEDSLSRLLKQGIIDRRTALARANNPALIGLSR